MEYKQIQELIKTINKSSISELSIEDGDFKITIKQEFSSGQVTYAAAPMMQQAMPMQQMQMAPQQQAAPAPSAAPAEKPAAAEAASNHGWSNFLAERQSAHKKHGWLLRATLAK